MEISAIRRELEEAGELLQRFLADPENLSRMAEAGGRMASSLQSGGKVITCGNGGSMCDAMHFAEEMTGKFRQDRRPFPALAISDPSYLTCAANDFGFETVFERFVKAHGRPGDTLLAISTSGNSANVVRAAQAAREIGMGVVGLTGGDGGRLAPLCDPEIRAPVSRYADRAQEIHLKVIHVLIGYIEGRLNV